MMWCDECEGEREVLSTYIWTGRDGAETEISELACGHESPALSV